MDDTKKMNEPEINEENMELTEENLNEAAGGINKSSFCPRCERLLAYCTCYRSRPR